MSWATRIFAFLVLVLAAGAIGAFLEVVLPQRVAQLAQSEAGELALARKGATDVSTAVTGLWVEISARGGISLSDEQLAKDLALAKATEKSADDALSHVQAAQGYMAQADGLPFQFHSPSFIITDRPALQHLDKALQATIKLTHGASLQLTLAQHLNQDAQTISGSLNPSLNNRAWTDAARTASALTTDRRTGAWLRPAPNLPPRTRTPRTAPRHGRQRRSSPSLTRSPVRSRRAAPRSGSPGLGSVR